MSETIHDPRERVGTPRKTGSEEVHCPDCGVKQRATVMVQHYEDNPSSHFIDRECPVCGFDGVWF